ncbi:cytochrome o ubiquinol oxidase subunit III [Sphingomonas abietis]|uniref:Cytochrome bo(3) ubiquinol oxidase subunit 3 n=1 Tax=Sphingomonas abietis TaxID=3012344 RepID=A0ABY7NIG5_9SPHN|nr:cytochrome o ubiquinol oxidase subunit III [Sphingomonas abietis]WBO21062.1 cytochrome o ubiquinol oxidase subunit III [Sphingomonas abietis]
MSDAHAIQSPHDPHRLGRAAGDRSGGHGHGHGHDHDGTGSGEGGPAGKRIIVGYGFWIFLLSDIIMFSAIFATYAVLQGATNGGPGGAQLFDLSNVAIETVCLLLSSFACGLAMIAANVRNLLWTQIGLVVTGLLGAAFLGLELKEFAEMIGQGAGPQRSAFLSAFFTLVGCHGLHVSVGLLWLGTMMAQLWSKGFRPAILRRLLCFSLFWHALDIIWVALFTIVYLLGAGQ